MYQEKKQNLLNQQFTVSRPNEVWVGDVTQFRFKGRNYYICVIIDLYSRKVVSYKISKSNSTQLTKATFKYAYESHQPTDLLFHSDRGGNYTSNAYTSYLEQLGIRQSFSRASTPYDNSVIEAFFKSLKAEKLYLIDIDSEKELFSAIKNYMIFYNSSRPHTVLSYTTPDAFEARFFSKIVEFAEDIVRTFIYIEQNPIRAGLAGIRGLGKKIKSLVYPFYEVWEPLLPDELKQS